MRRAQIVLLAVLTISGACNHSANAQESPRPVKVGVKVEAQGPEGLWTQAGKDLSPPELDELRSLLVAEIGKMKNHKLVSLDEKSEYLGVIVVAEKLICGRETYFIVSSALTIATTEGTDLLVTHDVFAEPNLTLAAKAITGQLAAAEFRAAFGLR